MNKDQFASEMERELATWKLIDQWFGSRSTADTVKMMSKVYADELFPVMSHNLLRQSFSIARRENKTVPAIKDFIEADIKAKASPVKSKSLQLPEFFDREYTPEELEHNHKRLKINMMVAIKKITTEDGVKLQRELMKGKIDKIKEDKIKLNREGYNV